MNKQIVLGFSAPKEGGKDMAANIIKSRLMEADVRVNIVRFADPLKDVVASLFGFDRVRINTDHEYKEATDPFWGISPRRALQVVGTELFRDGALKTMFNINMWVDKFVFTCQKMAEWDNEHGVKLRVILCTDARFHDEFVAIKNGLNGQLIFTDPRPRIMPAENPHASEKDMWEYTDWDYVLDYGHEMQKSIDETEELADSLIDFLT